MRRLHALPHARAYSRIHPSVFTESLLHILVWTQRVEAVSIMPKKQKKSSGDSTGRKPWVDPGDAPEITDELPDRVWKNAEIREGGRIIRPGRPPLIPTCATPPNLGNPNYRPSRMLDVSELCMYI
jgi:hypothetical protein